MDSLVIGGLSCVIWYFILVLGLGFGPRKHIYNNG